MKIFACQDCGLIIRDKETVAYLEKCMMEKFGQYWQLLDPNEINRVLDEIESENTI